MDYNNDIVKDIVEDTGYIVTHLNILEGKLNDIISEYLNLDKEKNQFLVHVVLNTAIIDFGKKLKIVFNISAYFETDLLKFKNDFHTLLLIRNKYAHHNPSDVLLDFDLDENTEAPENMRHVPLFRTINSKGKIEYESTKNKLDKFIALLKNVNTPLWELKNKIELLNKENKENKEKERDTSFKFHVGRKISWKEVWDRNQEILDK